MRTLIVGNSSSVYVRDFVKWMAKKMSVTFDILSWVPGRLESNGRVREFVPGPLPEWIGKIRKVRGLWKVLQYGNLLRKLGKYDMAHIHLVGLEATYFAGMIGRRCKTLIATVWGGDFHRTSRIMKKLQERVYRRAKLITFATIEMKEAFDRYYRQKYSEKLRICTFGLAPLDELKQLKMAKAECRKKFSIPSDATVVTIGYNAGCWHRHKEVLDSLSKVALPKNLFLVFPFTYAQNEQYIREIEAKILEWGFKNLILKDFMGPKETAILRKASDIMIQVQTTDVLSGSMLEHLYAGSVVITGDWLPYKVLDEMGIHVVKVGHASEVGEALAHTIKNLDELRRKNEVSRLKIYEFASWAHVIGLWISLYQEGGRK